MMRGQRPDGRHWASVEEETWDGRRKRRTVLGDSPEEVDARLAFPGMSVAEIIEHLIPAYAADGIEQLERYLDP